MELPGPVDVQHRVEARAVSVVEDGGRFPGRVAVAVEQDFLSGGGTEQFAQPGARKLKKRKYR